MRSRYKFIDSETPYFFTSTIIEWLPVFTSGKYFDIIIQSLKFCQKEKGLQLHAYVILDNHFHLVASAPDISGTLASVKKFTARKIIEELEVDGKTWLLRQFEFL